jgi:glycosyltransferase involved in cell wall biosynthesis
MRALFVTGSLPNGGAERHAISLLNLMAQRGHDCHAACVKAPDLSHPVSSLVPRGSLRSLQAARYFDRRAIGDLAAHISSLRPHVIVAANSYALMYASLARQFSAARARLVVTYHTTRLLNMKEHLQMLAYRPLFWAADCTVFLCQTQQRHWQRRGLFSRRSEVIHNGIDIAHFCEQQPQTREQTRRMLGIAESDYLIGTAALLRKEKNLLQLVDAVARLRKQGLPARALLIGDGEERQAIQARARALDIASAIVITGLQQDVRPYIAACDVMTLCSVTETFSLAALEAMALGKPIVLSDVGGASEMIVPRWNGMLFPVHDTDAYVERLAALSDRAVSSHMGSNARHLMERRFSATLMADRYEMLFASLCCNPPPRSRGFAGALNP